MRTPVFALLASLLLAASLSAQIVSTVAGNPVAGLRDGVGTDTQFDRPTWLDVENGSGAIYVVDRANQKLRKIVNGSVSTVPFASAYVGSLPGTFDFGGPYGGGIAVEPTVAGCGGSNYDHGMFVTSSAKNAIHFLVDMGFGVGYAQRDNAPALLTPFHMPGDATLSWNYGGNLSTYRTDALYVVDTGSHTVRKVTFTLSFEGCSQPNPAQIVAGADSEAGSTDGNTTTARFNAPRGIASAPDGSVYVADTGNHTIRRIAPNGIVTTVAGTAGVAGFNDGIGADALLNSPSGLDVNALGEVFIADTGNFVVRKLTVDGRLITIAGTPRVAGYADGPARAARFSGPVGLRLHDNALYIADTANNAIRKLDLTPAEPRRRSIHH